MTIRLVALFSTLMAALVAPAAAQQDQDTVCAALASSKQTIYGFRPLALTQEQRDKKSKLMDAFWQEAKQAKAQAIPCLRAMLQEEGADPFFLFDASALLFELDQTPETLQVVVAAVARSDLNDIDKAGYISLAMRLARHDVDIGPLAEKYLRHLEVDTYLPLHGGMKLERLSGAILLYGSMQPQMADRALLAALQLPEGEARAVAIFLLAHSMTEAGFRALQGDVDFSVMPEMGQNTVLQVRTYSAVQPPLNVKFPREKVIGRLRNIAENNWHPHPEPSDTPDWDNPPYVAEDEEFYASALATLTPEDLPLLYDARRKSVRGVSDESLYEYFGVTKLILGVVNRYDLFREFRIH